MLLTATPAKNSPLEFYNLIQFVDPTAFTRAGIRDPEQFIDRFLKIEIREVLDSTFEIIRRSAVTGFKNLEDLRTLIFRYGEFRTAQEVGLKLPRPVVETITIAMDEVQEAKYRHYVARIEEILSNPNPDSSPGNVILGLLAAAAAGSGSESVGQEGLADADRADDGDMRVGLEEAQGAQLVPELDVVADVGGRVPGLELMCWIEAGALGSELRRYAVAARDLVGEDHQDEVLVGHLLLPGESEPLGQGVEERPKLEAFEGLLQIGGDAVLVHDGSPVVVVVGSA